MKLIVLACAALAAAAVLLAGCGGSASSRQADEIAAAKQYVRSIAAQNSLAVDRITVLAVRDNGDQAVVRVQVRYHPYLLLPGMAKPLNGPEATVTLAVHLSDSRWYPEYGAVQ